MKLNRFAHATLSSLITCTVFLVSAAPHQAFAKDETTAVASASNRQAKKQLEKLMRDFYEFNVRFQPVEATLNGDNRFDDKLNMDIVPRIRANRFAQYHQFSQQLHKIKLDQLDRTDQTSVGVLDNAINTVLSFESFPNHLLPIQQMENIPSTLANFADGNGSQPISNPKQYRAYLTRISQLPGWVDQAIANMKEGIKVGVVQPKALIVSTLPQFKKLISATPEGSVFYTPIKNLPESFSSADKKSLTNYYRESIEKRINPALTKLVTFLEKEYLPASRSSTGWSELPNGKAWYAAYVAATTTTALTADEIHAIGLKEVARIQSLFALLGPKMGYTGPAADLPNWVAMQEKFYPYKTGEEILDVFNKLNAKLDSKLPALFSLIPKSKLEIRLEPELTRATASSHYTPPGLDGTRPGIFWLVAEEPKKFNSTQITSLFLHEGRPGHHFQIALQKELPLPDFRKNGYNTAYTEGWALYAESLGRELGLYGDADADQYFGNLNLEMLRAVRLVVDTGMHAKGWSRERSIKYMRDTLGLSEAEATNATERYMALPGQALGYKIGAMKIAELRQKATAALGPKFNLPEFHALIIDEGTLPMTMLDAKVDRWIAEKSATSSTKAN